MKFNFNAITVWHKKMTDRINCSGGLIKSVEKNKQTCLKANLL